MEGKGVIVRGMGIKKAGTCVPAPKQSQVLAHSFAEFEGLAVVLEAAVVAAEARVSIGAFGVAGTLASGFDEVEHGVLLAVDAHFLESEEIAGGFSFDPKFVAGSAPEGGHFFAKRGFECEPVDIADDQHFARFDILGDGRNDVLGALGHDLAELGKVEIESGAFFEFVVRHKWFSLWQRQRKRRGRK